MSKELYRTSSRFHAITVTEENGATTLRIDGIKQSAMDVATGDAVRQPYLDYLHLAVAMVPDARRLLCIGLGGGVFPRRVWTDYPDVSVDVVELDPDVVRVARQFFGLPDDARLRVHEGDGRAFLETTPAAYDIIVVDAFFGSLMPYVFATSEFAALAAGRLSAGGVLVYNTVAVMEGPQNAPFQRFLRSLAAGFADCCVFPVGVPCGGGREQIVLAASRAPVDRQAFAAQIRSCVEGRVKVAGFATFADRLLPRTVPSPEIVPYVDADAPADGMLHV